MPLLEPVPLESADALGPVHFIAIGGAGMSAVASAYAARGVAVSGSDQADSAALRRLAEEGVTTYVGHDTAQLGEAQTVVVSTAVRPDNVELVEARRRGLRVWHRSAALAALMEGHVGVAVTGTHGKTTTTAMIATLLAAVNEDPSYVLGSPLSATGRSSQLGRGRAFVVEADESDGSFRQYPAAVVVVTNVEADHLDNWGTAKAYREGFSRLCAAAPVTSVIACGDDEGAREVAGRARRAGKRVVTYGEAADADVRLSGVTFTPDGASAKLTAVADARLPADAGPLALSVPGRYNLLNAAAAYAAGRELGVDGARLREAAPSFHGTFRRFQLVGEAGGVRVVDDYAHHPTELAATLSAARPMAGAGRVIACFQPHLYSRTAEFAGEFAAALGLADEIVVLGIYAAREDPVPGVTGLLVADAVRARGRAATFVEDLADAPGVLARLAEPGDVVITLGAGDVTTVGPRLLPLLAERG